MIKIDFRQLTQETLENLLTECVLREGTDYGEAEVPMDVKREQLRKKLISGEGVIMYHEEDGFCEIIKR